MNEDKKSNISLLLLILCLSVGLAIGLIMGVCLGARFQMITDEADAWKLDRFTGRTWILDNKARWVELRNRSEFTIAKRP